MTLRLAYAIVLTSPLLASCFRPDLICLPCRENCPGNLVCEGSYCVDPDVVEDQVAFCRKRFGGDSDAGGTAHDARDAGGGPSEVCAERCCVGASCLEFPARLQRGLLLWADRTSLPPVGQIVERWRDRSPRHNDITNVNFGKGPRVQVDEIGPIAEISERSMVMATQPGPELRFGFEDFTILIVARCDSNTQLGTLFDRIVPVSPRTGLTLYCNHDGGGVLGPGSEGSKRVYLKLTHEDLLDAFGLGAVVSKDTFEPDVLRLYVARRISNEVQIRVDGQLQGRVQIPGSLSLMEETPAFIGAVATIGGAAHTDFDGGIATLIIVRGPLADDELASLESFIMATSGPRVTRP